VLGYAPTYLHICFEYLQETKHSSLFQWCNNDEKSFIRSAPDRQPSESEKNRCNVSSGNEPHIPNEDESSFLAFEMGTDDMIKQKMPVA
jgi:hypothetical protein